jgi:hypothetical protein
VHGGDTILTENKKIKKAVALNPHRLSPRAGGGGSLVVWPLCTKNATPYNEPIPRVVGPACTPLPAHRKEAFQRHTNVIHGSSCSVPFTVSLLSVSFGEIALMPCASSRDFPNSCLWLLLHPLSSHISQASVFKICGSCNCTKTLRYRHQRS